MSNPFFLTRQSANLMEDFVRELEEGSALFLLYGETGVGKTRLLQELAQSRLAERAVYWLDLDSADGSEETRMDRSAEVEALFAAAGSGDIVIADHFEMALKKTRHQLFLSWSTDGIDKQLNLIISSNVEGFNELRQLSQQYGVRMQSFQQMPFSTDEVQAFLGFYLFPERPAGKLGIPSPLRKQIAATQGVVGRLIELAGRDGSQIETESPAESETGRRGGRIFGYALLAVLLAAGLVWYLLPRDAAIGPPPITLNQPGEAAPAEGAPIEVAPSRDDAGAGAARVPIEVVPYGAADGAGERSAEIAALPAGGEPTSAAAASDVAAARIETAAGADEESAQIPPVAEVMPAAAEVTPPAAEVTPPAAEVTAAVPAEGESSAAEATLELSREDTAAAAEADIAEVAAGQPIEPGTVPESEAVMTATLYTEPPASAGADDAQPAPTSEQRFRDELRRSMDWLQARDDSVGTIQILLLSYENFDADNYYDYVDGLARSEVDVERLRVFKTLTGNREVYSVVYGEYDDRRSAFGAIAELPAVLRDTAPLARSVGGLWQEIRRLDTVN